MFQSYSQANGKFTIIDSDFQETVDNHKYFAEIIIEAYSRRNLNVALNFVLFMQYENKKYVNGWSIDNQIYLYKCLIKNFDKYLPEIIQEEQNQIQVANDFLEENNLSEYKSKTRMISIPVDEFLKIVSKK